jgi:hypothetical protein
MPGLAAFEQVQGAVLHKPPHRLSHRVGTQPNTTGKPGNRKPQSQLPFHPAVSHEMGIHHAVHGREVQPLDQHVLALFPHVFGIRFFVFHV